MTRKLTLCIYVIVVMLLSLVVVNAAEISLNLTQPTAETSLHQNESFSVAVDITCLLGDCGEISAQADADSQIVSTTEGDAPFYTTVNPQIITLNENETASLTWQITATGEPNTYSLKVQAQNADASSETNPFSVQILAQADTTPPEITIASPTERTYNTSSLQISVTISEDGTASYSLDEAANVSMGSGTSFNQNLNDLAEGQHTLTVYATDSAGNIQSKSLSFSVQIPAPPPDSDGDGVADSEDNLVGDNSYISASGTGTLSMTIGGNTAGATASGTQEVVIKDNDNAIAVFSYNFDQQPLNLSKIQIAKSSTSIVTNFSGQIDNKTLYLDDNNFTRICVKDDEISSVSQISSSCDSTREFNFTSCLGGSSSKSGITCTDEGTKLKFENLRHSGILGIVDTNSGDNGDGGDGDGDGILDGDDTLFGDFSDILGNGLLALTIDGNSSLGNPTGTKSVIITLTDSDKVNFTHNFDLKDLFLNNITVFRFSNDSRTSIITNFHGQLQNSKTIYLEKKNYSSICVKNMEINSVSQISASCDGDSEYNFTSCLGGSSSKSGITCTDEGTKLKFENLDHTGILGIIDDLIGLPPGNTNNSNNPPPPSSGGGNSGGGSGGGSSGGASGSSTGSAPANSITKIWPSLAPGIANFSIDSSFISVMEIRFNVLSQLTNVQMTVIDLGSNASVSKPSGYIVYKYFEINPLNLPSSSFTEATIAFLVEKNWLNGNKFSDSDVILLRLNAGQWSALETAKSSGPAFRAITPGFSTFAIAAKNGEAQQTAEQELRPETQKPNNSSIGNLITGSLITQYVPVNAPISPFLFWLVAGVIIIGAVIGYLIFTRDKTQEPPTNNI